MKWSLDPDTLTITDTTNKAPVIAAILSNFYVIDTENNKFAKVEAGGELELFTAQILTVGVQVIAVHWDWNGDKVTTHAVVNGGHQEPGSNDGVMESVTGTYTKSTPKVANKFVPQAAPFEYRADFEDGFRSPVAVFKAEVKCNQPAIPACSIEISCSDVRSPVCKCEHRERVECVAGRKCFAEIAFVGYCGTPRVTFDETNWRYVVDRRATYHNTYLQLERICNCRPPK
jgi:hypothetical protein